MQSLKVLIQQLPPYNRYTLQHLMSFLQMVVEHEAGAFSITPQADRTVTHSS